MIDNGDRQRSAIVTGAAQGIGFNVASALARLGHSVFLLDLAGPKLEAACAELARDGHAVSALPADVSDPRCVAEAVAQAAGSGSIDILVNNAGISPSHDGGAQRIEDMPLDEWDRVLAVNLTGTFLMCREVLPVMKRGRWGRIVNFSSQGGRMRSDLSGAHYGATKAGVIGFTRVLAGQVGSHGITANCIAPGRIETDQSRSFGDRDDYRQRVPVGRLGEVDDIAAGVEYLVSDRAAFVTGTVLDINGGFFMP